MSKTGKLILIGRVMNRGMSWQTLLRVRYQEKFGNNIPKSRFFESMQMKWSHKFSHITYAICMVLKCPTLLVGSDYSTTKQVDNIGSTGINAHSSVRTLGDIATGETKICT